MGTEQAVELAAGLCKHFEGLKLKAYKCPAGVWTIGYGHTKTAKPGMQITVEQAEALLQQDLAEAMLAVLRLCPKAVAKPKLLAALIDFTFNLGSGNLAASTLRRKINAEELDEVPEQLRRWVRVGGKILRGLVLRREAEIALFTGGTDGE